jgi:uncharacterized Zn-binding protein involved in type VI secretion
MCLMKHRVMAFVGVSIMAVMVCALSVRLSADPAPADTRQAPRLPGVWKLSKVTCNEGEGEVAIFEDGEGSYPLSGQGADTIYGLHLGYAWFVPTEITPGRPFQASLNICLSRKLDDKARDDLTGSESYLAIYKGDHQQTPQEICPRQAKHGDFGYKIPDELLVSDTWLGGATYGQEVKGVTVGVVYQRDAGVIWYTYYYTFTEAAIEDSDGEEKPNDQNDPTVQLHLTYPVGRSPKVFTSGWVFGARCTTTTEDGEVVDLSEQVQWSGSGTFKPVAGKLSRPTFSGAGGNTIVLTIDVDGKTITRTRRVEAITTTLYASVGDTVTCEACAHGCPACPHPTVGEIRSGSSLVHINGLPAARVGDVGANTFECCGENFFVITSGDSQVLINGRPAAKIRSATKHCGGIGKITSAAP